MKLRRPSSITDVHYVIEEPERVTIVAQPIADLQRVVVVGYEALARFELPSGRKSPPNEIFGTAIRAGLGETLEAVVLRRALEAVARPPPNCFVTINVDPIHLTSRLVMDVIGSHGDLGGLIFELTEHNTVDDLEELKRALATLKRRGAMIAIDDVGTGYSGLRQIIELQPQFIKLDRELVAGIDKNEAKRVLVKMLGDLANRLDAWVLAEGIETEAELNSLIQIGVPLGQGFLLAKPSVLWSNMTPGGEAALERLTRKHEKTRAGGRASISPVPKERALVVAELIEPCEVCRGDEDWPKKANVAVRVDKNGRPIEMRLVSEEEGVRLRMEYDLLRAKRDGLAAEVAIRTTTRDDRLRWDPVVCIDDRGHLEGLVYVHRLLEALAHRALPPMPAPKPQPQPQAAAIDDDITETGGVKVVGGAIRESGS